MTLGSKDSKPIWKRLLQGTELFLDHKDYLAVILTADTEDEHLTWYGSLQSFPPCLIESQRSADRGCAIDLVGT